MDGTCGRGGHARYILEHSEGIRLVGIDKDEEAVRRIRETTTHDSFQAVHGGYEDMDGILAGLGIREADGVLLDLGFSLDQVTDPARGFSFQLEGPLDMRYDRNQPVTAAEILNRYPRGLLAKILAEYGGIHGAERIADRIIRERTRRAFCTTSDLARFAERIRGRRSRIHPATRFFQALRIAVNREYDVIPEGLRKACAVLRRGGRLVVISFHSGEDRIVKFFLRGAADMTVLTRKPVMASRAEVVRNPRSRSAKLRAAEKR